MNRRAGLRIVERVMWLATMAASLALFEVMRPRERPDASGAMAQALAVIPTVPALWSDDSLEDAVESITHDDIFTRTASDAQRPIGAPAPPVATPRPPRPTLVVRGVLGPPWDVVLDGIPGRDGSTVLRIGEVVSGISVRAIRADTVIVRGQDTTWTLTLRRP